MALYKAAISRLTEAELDSAFARGPEIWKFMPTPEEFIGAVQVQAKESGCEKCANGFVADPERGPRAVKRCGCQKQSANVHVGRKV